MPVMSCPVMLEIDTCSMSSGGVGWRDEEMGDDEALDLARLSPLGPPARAGRPSVGYGFKLPFDRDDEHERQVLADWHPGGPSILPTVSRAWNTYHDRFWDHPPRVIE